VSVGTFETDFRLAQADIAIVGLGLMGASLALALRGYCASIVGVDQDPDIVSLALDRGIVDKASVRAEEVLPHANLIILAAPVRSILELIAHLPEWHPGKALVMDLGSTKAEICNALDRLPRHFDALGGHPMCGSELGGLENADPQLFSGAPFAFCSIARTSSGAKNLAVQICSSTGAFPLWLEASIHDQWAAATSHAPYLLSAAVVLSTAKAAAPLIGSGFQSISRLAASQPEMMIDILTTNRKASLSILSQIRNQIEQLERLLEDGDDAALKDQLGEARNQHHTLMISRKVP